MRVGAVFSQADSGTDPAAIRAWARAAEAAGYQHLMAYDHVLGASGELFPSGVGSFPAAPYTHEHTFHEILVLFAHLAAVTEAVELVTSVLILPQRQTAVVAKQVSTIDLLSGGRLRLAVGVGWNWAEYAALGTDFDSREERLEEQISVMRRLWAEPLVTFSGRFHQLDRVGINPLPSRPIPIWIGSGASPRACCDGSCAAPTAGCRSSCPGSTRSGSPKGWHGCAGWPTTKAGIPPRCPSTAGCTWATASRPR